MDERLIESLAAAVRAAPDDLPLRLHLAGLLDSLGIVSPLLVGMSQGARVVLEFAARHPGPDE